IRGIYQKYGQKFPLVDRRLQVSNGSYLRINRIIVEGTDLEALLHWITPDLAQKFDDMLKDRFRLHILTALRRRVGIPLKEHDRDRLCNLPVYRKMVADEQ